MNKSKLEILLEEVGKLTLPPLLGDLANAYQDYMEERKSIPQSGQDIEVRDHDEQEWVIRKFIAFCPSGRCIAYNEGDKRGATFSYPWQHYRIPVPKKKWKVVKDGIAFIVVEFEHETDLPTITTFED